MSSIDIPKKLYCEDSQFFQAINFTVMTSNHKLKCLRIRFQNGEGL